MYTSLYRARHQQGVSLIELIFFILIVGVMMSGMVSNFSLATKASTDPVIGKQALSLAQSALEEVLLQPVGQTGNAVPGCGVARSQFDDVLDYNGCSWNASVRVDGSAEPDAEILDQLNDYTVTVTVADATPSGGVTASLPAPVNGLGSRVQRIQVAVVGPNAYSTRLVAYALQSN